MLNRNPLADIFQVFDDIERFIQNSDRYSLSGLYPEGNFPAYDVYVEKDKKENQNLVYEIALAGYAKDEIEVEFESDWLKISLVPQEKADADTEKKYIERKLRKRKGHFKFFTPTSKFNVSKAEADFKEGIVKITIPFTEESKGRKILLK